MRASYRWLCELCGLKGGEISPEEMADRLTGGGLEVEEIEAHGLGLDRVVIARVVTKAKVPDKDKLSLVTVFDGTRDRQIICGAPNVPEPGRRVLLALPGAELPNGMKIAEREVGGVRSEGMLCSETELAIGEDTSGIVVLDMTTRGRPGEAAAEVLGLRDWVFEIGLTPNRPDALGHVGLARELCLLLGRPFEPRSPGMPPRVLITQPQVPANSLRVIVAEEADDPSSTSTLVHPSGDLPVVVPIRIEDPERCPRYAGAVVHGARVEPSPFWLRHRLHLLGLRPINNIVDITNLVLFEQGHPIHAFDLARLSGPEIVVRLAKEGETMKTLDEAERPLTPDDLLICDGAGPVALAGVMGGHDSEIRDETRDVLIECAYFDPRSIRRTSRRLGLHTDSSHRFERGVDPNAIPRVIRRTVELVTSIAGGGAAPFAADLYPSPIAEKQILFRPARARALLGIDLPRARQEEILRGVGARLGEADAEGNRIVRAPTFRPDLGREEDLIEELVRVEGFGAVPEVIPPVRAPEQGGSDPRLSFERRLRELGATLGLLEARSLSFLSRAELVNARVSVDAVPLANPLSEERAVMRTSLLPGLLGAAGRARRRQVESVRLFELARSFHPRRGERLPEERHTLAFLLVGPRPAWIGEGPEHDFYDGKGIIEGLASAAIGGRIVAAIDERLDLEAPFLHPRRCARIHGAGAASEIALGLLGELHPELTEDWGLEGRAIYGELSIDALMAAGAALGMPQATALPRHPSVSRDVAALLPLEVQADAATALMREVGGALVEEVRLFDLYLGEGVPEGKKSLAFRVVYRDADKTLTDKRVDGLHTQLIEALVGRLGAEIRA